MFAVVLGLVESLISFRGVPVRAQGSEVMGLYVSQAGQSTCLPINSNRSNNKKNNNNTVGNKEI